MFLKSSVHDLGVGWEDSGLEKVGICDLKRAMIMILKSLFLLRGLGKVILRVEGVVAT